MWLSVWLLKRTHTLKGIWHPITCLRILYSVFNTDCKVRRQSGAHFCGVTVSYKTNFSMLACDHIRPCISFSRASSPLFFFFLLNFTHFSLKKLHRLQVSFSAVCTFWFAQILEYSKPKEFLCLCCNLEHCHNLLVFSKSALSVNQLSVELSCV